MSDTREELINLFDKLTDEEKHEVMEHIAEKKYGKGYAVCEYCGELYVKGEPFCPWCGKECDAR